MVENYWNIDSIRSKKLIIGLGNKKYPLTRHSIGHMILDNVAKHRNVRFTTYSNAEIAYDSNYILLKPSYMNSSGKPVLTIMKKERIPSKNILVVVDDIYIPFGSIRLKSSGGSGGHNGLQDIIDRIATKDFTRLRIGIGHNFEKGQQGKFVLGKWTNEEMEQISTTIEHAVMMINEFILMVGY